MMYLLKEIINVNDGGGRISNVTNNAIVNFCKDTANVWQIVGYIFLVLRILVPIILIILGMIDISKAIISNEEKALKTNTQKLLKRFIIGLAIFFVPTLVAAFFNLIVGINVESPDYNVCVQCVVNPYNYNDCGQYADIANEYADIKKRKKSNPSFKFKQDYKISKVSLEKDKLELKLSSTKKMIATIHYYENEEKHSFKATSNDVIWESSDSKIVTVSNNGYVEPQGVGDAEIIVKVKDNPNIFTKCDVSVIDDSEKKPLVEDKPDEGIIGTNISKALNKIKKGDGNTLLSSQNIKSDLSELQEAIKKHPGKCSFLAIRINDGAYVAYNAHTDKNCELSEADSIENNKALYKSASIIKILPVLYAYKKINDGNAGEFTFKNKLKYEDKTYEPNSGYIVNHYKPGDFIFLEDVIYHSINISDNIAHVMLTDYIWEKDKQGLVKYSQKLGCSHSYNFSNDNRPIYWPVLSATDVALWWNDIYAFAGYPQNKDDIEKIRKCKRYSNDSRFNKDCDAGKKLYNIFLNAEHNRTKKALKNNYEIAHKSGTTETLVHDSGIVENGTNSYLFVILTYGRNKKELEDYFKNDLVPAIHNVINS